MIFKLPSFKLLFLYITAILLGRYFDLSAYFVWEVGIGISGILISFLLYRIKKRHLFNLIISLSFLFLFLSYYHHTVELKSANHLTRLSQNVTAFYGKVVSYPFYKEKVNKFIDCKAIKLEKPIKRQEYTVETKEVRLKNGDIISVSGNILVKSRNLLPELKIGDWVAVKSKAYSIKGIKPCTDFDYRQYLANIEIDYLAYPWEKAKISITITGDLNWIEESAAWTHDFLAELYSEHFSITESLFIKGLTLGVRGEIQEKIKEDFRKTGVFHILAISGLHVGMLASFLFVLLGSFRIPTTSFRISNSLKLILISVVLIFYVYIVGYRPSVVRATIMFICGSLVFILDRDRNWLNALFLAGLVILFWNPLSLFTLGFQLSFLATLGILLYLKRFYDILFKLLPINAINGLKLPKKLNKALFWVVKSLISLLSLTLSAQILIFPLLVYHFGGFSIISLISNIPIVILTQFAVALGFLLPLVSFSDYLLQMISWVLEHILSWIIQLSQFFANLFFSYIDDLEVGWWFFVGYYPLIIFIFHYKEVRNYLFKALNYHKAIYDK